MRILQFIGVTMALMQLLGCGAEAPRWERTYQIKNSSNYDITIRIYENYTGIGTFEDINLFNNEVYTGGKTRGSNFNTLNDLDSTRPASSLNGSRLIIVYNNEKKTTHSFDVVDDVTVFSTPTSRNLIRSGNYTHIGNDIYEYVLTEEDYNNATPCNGDCLD